MRPTRPDGLILSRWRRHRSTPFGAEFAYTDPDDLKTIDHTRVLARPWYTRLWPKKRPLAYLIIDKDDDPAHPVQAQLVPRGIACRISPIELRAYTPIYDRKLLENVIIALDEGLFFTDTPTPHE